MEEKTTTVTESQVETKAFEFPSGIFGFPMVKRYVIAEVPGGGDIFKQMIALDQPDLGFTLVSPFAFFPDYAPDIPDEELAELEPADGSQVILMAIATVPENIKEATANLRAPVLFNPFTRKGRQVILADDRYPTRARLVKA
ncbi:MAG: flagellar assembly protein FliW [Mycobacterium leprae]